MNNITKAKTALERLREQKAKKEAAKKAKKTPIEWLREQLQKATKEAEEESEEEAKKTPFERRREQLLQQQKATKEAEERSKIAKQTTSIPKAQDTDLSNNDGIISEKKKLRKAAKRLLADIIDIFNASKVSEIRSQVLIDQLCSDDTKQWATYCEGQKLHFRRLALLLGQFNIESKDIRFKDKTFKGYEKDKFVSALKSLAAKKLKRQAHNKQ